MPKTIIKCNVCKFEEIIYRVPDASICPMCKSKSQTTIITVYDQSEVDGMLKLCESALSPDTKDVLSDLKKKLKEYIKYIRNKAQAHADDNQDFARQIGIVCGCNVIEKHFDSVFSDCGLECVDVEKSLENRPTTTEGSIPSKPNLYSDKKCVNFVMHIQRHLDVMDKVSDKRPHCKICNTDIDTIDVQSAVPSSRDVSSDSRIDGRDIPCPDCYGESCLIKCTSCGGSGVKK